MANPKNILIGVHTDLGLGRDLNEDYFGTPSSQNIPETQRTRGGILIAVADGMGGHAAGEFASKTAIETLFETFYNATEKEPENALANAYAEANKAVFEIEFV